MRPHPPLASYRANRVLRLSCPCDSHTHPAYESDVSRRKVHICAKYVIAHRDTTSSQYVFVYFITKNERRVCKYTE